MSGSMFEGTPVHFSSRQSLSSSIDLFVPDSIIVGETVREAVNFFGKRVEGWQGDGRLEYGADDSNPFAGWFSTTPFSKPTFFSRAVAHMIKGFSFLGIISFFQTFFGESQSSALHQVRSLIRDRQYHHSWVPSASEGPLSACSDRIDGMETIKCRRHSSSSSQYVFKTTSNPFRADWRRRWSCLGYGRLSNRSIPLCTGGRGNCSGDSRDSYWMCRNITHVGLILGGPRRHLRT